ncbi:MAG: beta-lactamase family protein [Bacteroidetes bacterium]|nr:beta-lactamase family protein [Bacteroidota bacterium]
MLLLLVFTVSPLIAQPEPVHNLITDYINSLPAKAEVAIAYVDGENTWRYGAIVGENGPITTKNYDRLFEIGSITKTFTTSLLMKTLSLGEMELDDPIQDYIPVQMEQDSFQGRTITLKHLAMHTSGLSTGPKTVTWAYLRALIFHPQNPNRNFKAKQYYKYLEKFSLDYIPGKAWEYNNFAMALLGDILARHYNQPYEQLVKERIFAPLGMQNSCFKINENNEEQAVTGYNEKGKKTARWEMDFITAAGGINASLNDMLRYLRANMEPPKEETAFLHPGHENFDYQYTFNGGDWAMGIGWWHRLKDDPNRTIIHSGATGGFTSFLGFDKASQRGFIVLVNFAYDHPKMRTAEDLNKTYELGRGIMRLNVD